MCEGNRVNVLVEDKGKGDGEVENVEALGTESKRKNFYCVCHNDGSEGNATKKLSTSIKEL